MGGRRFETLDGLRGIAALAVVTRHAPGFFGSPGPFPESYLAVDFFFALSGFVLAHAYGQKLCAGMTPRHFMAIRLIRLYPLYFAGLVIGFLIALRQALIHQAASETFLQFAFGLLILPFPSMDPFPLNGPSWSLHFELVGNLVFALIARHLSLRRLFVVVGVSGCALVLAAANRWLGFGTASGHPAGALETHVYLGCLIRVTFSFFCGVLIYRLWEAGTARKTVPPLLIAILFSMLIMSRWSPTYQLAFELVATLVLFPALIFLGASSAPSGILARGFSLIGRVSYAVYVLQVSVHAMMYGAAQTLSAGQEQFSWPLGVLFVGVTFAFAVWADSRYDQPVRTILNRRMVGRLLNRAASP